MSSKLFLTSSGLTPAVTKSFLDHYGQDPQGHEAVFIPTAADPEMNHFYVGMARRELRDLGFAVHDVDLKGHTPTTLRKALQSAKVIYVNGGNTFYLLHWARKAGMARVLPELLQEGRVYVGSSAGSILAGPDISTAGWKPVSDDNSIGLTDFTGMHLVGFAPFVHYHPAHALLIQNQLTGFAHPVIPLSDGQAIMVENFDYHIVGVSEPIIWNDLPTH